MPQLWLTYDEIAAEFGCSAQEARETAGRQGYVRKRSRDGLTRVSMPHDLMMRYFASVAERFVRIDRQADEMTTTLRAMLQRATAEECARSRPMIELNATPAAANPSA